MATRDKTPFLLVLSGEGPTDLGQNRPAASGSRTFSPGPMAFFVQKLIHQNASLQIKETVYFSENDLSKEIKSSMNSRGKMKFPGKKAKTGSTFFYKNAYALGLAAERETKGCAIPYIAVLFRDNDGSRSIRSDLAREEKILSMAAGFEAAGCTTGVPMIPQPKSEAWLLCALSNKYQGCDKLEKRSGNDNSPNSLKMELEAVLHNRYKQTEVNADTLNDLINSGEIEPLKISMGSFNEFRESLLGKLAIVKHIASIG